MKKLPAGDAFSTARVWQLMKHFITLHRKSWENAIILILVGILLIYVLIFSLADPENIIRGTGDEETGIQQWYVLLGCLLSSRLFIEIHKPSTSWQFLSLPTTSVEKFMAAWLIAVPFYTILAIGVGLILKLIQTGVGLIYFGELLEAQISLSGLLQSFGIYLIWSSVFLWGAVFFKSLHFIKTASSAAGVVIVLTGSFALLLFNIEAIEPLSLVSAFSNNLLADVMLYGMAVSFTLLMLYLGYERLTKAEVRP
jgi:hypothetical protein